MSYRTYQKAIWQSFKDSKARFISMMSLMALGAFALVGLLVTPTNMKKTAQSYISKTNMMDLAVIADYGFSHSDKQELKKIENAILEYYYFTDLSIRDKDKAIRLFSLPDTISTFQVVKGKLPQNEREVALDKVLMSQYKIGDTITFTSNINKTNILKTTSFKVTGFIKPSDMWFSDNYGQSREGDGQLQAVGTVVAEAFDSPAHSMVKIRFKDLIDLPYYSETYQEKLEGYQEQLEIALNDNGQVRFSELKSELKHKVGESKDKVSQVEEILSSLPSKSELENSASHLDANLELLKNVKASLDNTKNQLDSTKYLLDNTKAQLEERHKVIELEAEQLSTEKQHLDDFAAKISSEQSALAREIQKLEDGDNSSTSNIELEIKASQIEKWIETYNIDFETYQSNLSNYENHLADYQNRSEQYRQGVKSYDESLAIYESSLANYQASLDQLQSAQKDFNTKLPDSLKGKFRKDVDGNLSANELEKAKRQIDDAEKQLENLTVPKYTVYNRSTFPGAFGYEVYQSATENIAIVGSIFPIVLYLVAALVTMTTMTRFVDEERQYSGILKALGYSNRQIMLKFLSYATVTSIIGTLIGSVSGYYILSPLVGNLLTSNSVLEKTTSYAQPSYVILAFILAGLSTILPTIIVTHRELRGRSAQLLQAKPPVQGESILLEKIHVIWDRLSFTQKVTARNIFRYKQRLIMTVFGVAGSVMLLFAGLGIRSSISGVNQRQYDELLHYHFLVFENKDAAPKEESGLKQTLNSNSEVGEFLRVEWESIPLVLNGQKEEVGLIITDSSLKSFVTLVNRENAKDINLGDKGIILTEKLAILLNKKIGDAIDIELNDKKYSLLISNITEQYAGHQMYISKAYFEKVTNTTYEPNAYYVKTNHQSEQKHTELARELLEQNDVKAVIQNKQLRKQLNSLADSLTAVMGILIIVTTVLTIVILYNLTNINVSERIRELSTIKVLGFHDNEVSLYIYRETLLLSLIGMVLGLIGGHYLHRIIINQIGSSQIMFNPQVTIEVYLIPVLIISSIILILGIWLHYKLKKLDMLDALKAME